MTITIDDKYLIDVDKFNYTLLERTGRKDKHGNEIFKIHGHHSTLEYALQALARLRVVSENETLTLNGYIRELERITQEIVRAVQGVRDSA